MNFDFYAAAAAAIPVFALTAIVDLRNDEDGETLGGFYLLLLQLAIGAIGEVAAFYAIGAQKTTAWLRAGVIAGLVASGVFLFVRVLYRQATTTAHKWTLHVILGGAILAAAIWIVFALK